MRKRGSKLALHRETVYALSHRALGLAAGGSDTSAVCPSAVPTLCDPSGNSQCESACYVCPLRPPTIEN